MWSENSLFGIVMEQLGFLDVVFILLGVATAFRVGKGAPERGAADEAGDEAEEPQEEARDAGGHDDAGSA